VDVRPRTVVILAILAFAAAMSLVLVRHHARALFVELQAQRAENDQLGIEWNRLLIERETWSLYRMVDFEARRKLDMVMPREEQIETVVVAGGQP
jgi:cell division protein FtsL